MAGNILSFTSVRNQTGRNTNRGTIRFGEGLKTLLDNAKNPNHPVYKDLPEVRDRIEKLSQAWYNPTDGYGVSDSLELSLLSYSWPKVETERGDIFRFNDSIKVVNKIAPITEMTVTFYDYINGSASAIMLAWSALVADKNTGAMGFKRDYALPTADIYGYGPNAPAEKNPTWYEWHQLTNLYPVDVDLGEQSYEGGEIRKVTVMFVYDNIVAKEYRGRQE